MNIAIFASGNGGNFQAIAESVNAKAIKATISLLFCDQKKAPVIKRANAMNIPVITFSPREYSSKKEYELELLNELKNAKVELIVLAGYMRIIGPTILKEFSNRIINIHPSLLPNFPGLHGIKEAYKANVKETGVTIHYVDNGIDTGPIIAQEKIAVTTSDTLESLEKKIHQIEHRLYPEVLGKLINNV